MKCHLSREPSLTVLAEVAGPTHVSHRRVTCFLRAIMTTVSTLFFLQVRVYCLARRPMMSRDSACPGLYQSPNPSIKSSNVSTEHIKQLTDCSAETHSWLLFGKIWGSSVCQLVKVTEEPLDHSKETGIVLLLKPIHVADAFSVRDKCKLFTGILLYVKEIMHWGYYQNTGTTLQMISACKS